MILDGVANEEVSARMCELFEQDQAARTADSEPIDWVKVSEADRQRRVEVMAYLENGRLATATNFLQAAFIFQHGNCPDHYRFANQLAQRAIELGEENGRWLFAASLDRYYLSIGRRQKFGTQYTLSEGRWELRPIDPNTTDEERAKYNVPTLASAQAFADHKNSEKKDHH